MAGMMVKGDGWAYASYPWNTLTNIFFHRTLARRPLRRFLQGQQICSRTYFPTMRKHVLPQSCKFCSGVIFGTHLHLFLSLVFIAGH